MRRIDTPRAQDTLRLSSPFRLKAAVDCHNPIIKLRVEITDRSEAAGDGNVLAAIELPTSGTTEVRVDTLLAFHQLSRMTSDNRYGFVLVEVYEGREYRAGFEPLVVLGVRGIGYWVLGVLRNLENSLANYHSLLANR